jgi:hypothetical protein
MFRTFGQRKPAKMQWVQDPNQSYIDILNKVRHEASKHFRNKKKQYLKDKIDNIATNRKIKKILETCVRSSRTLRRVTSLALI